MDHVASQTPKNVECLLMLLIFVHNFVHALSMLVRDKNRQIMIIIFLQGSLICVNVL